MDKFYPNKISLFITSTIFIAIAVCGCTRDASYELPGTQEAPKATETADTPLITEAKETDKEIKINGLGEEQKILSFDMVGYSKDGRKKWDIQGQSANVVSDTVILSEIEANAYNEDRTVVLKARSGQYDKKRRSVRLEDGVTVETSDGISLAAEWLEWESETDVIETETFVEVKKDNLYAAGYGASASTKHKEVKIEKDIIVKQDDVTINCSGPLAIDYDNNKASFHDRVKIVEPRGELLADRLDVFFNPDSRKIEKVIAERNVELRRGPNIAKGQKIVYTLADGEAVLTGNPEILIYSKKDLEDAFTGN